MKIELKRSVDITQTARALQLFGLFDVPPSERSTLTWSVDLPIESMEWSVGLIVGPSGSGKSTLAREAFSDAIIDGYEWPADKAVVDGFPAELGIKDITAVMSSVGFSSPPAWLRPFRCLSNGEQFRATLARALVDPRPLVLVDEFTSVVDRTVAQVGSAAVAKAVRRTPGKRFVAVTCHEDVEAWLCPDWVVRMPNGEFARRTLRRPPINLEICRVGREVWDSFKHHHYLDTSLTPVAKCFAAFWRGRPVAFASCLHNVGRLSFWREHRTVCLPDFQGVGIGNALSEFVAGVMKATGKQYRSTTSNPAMIRHRTQSPLWRCSRTPSLSSTAEKHTKSKQSGQKLLHRTRATNRLTAGFEYLGPARVEDARRMGVI